MPACANHTEQIDRSGLYIEVIPFHSCWEWIGYCDSKGYGNYRHNGKTVYAHRFLYEKHKGKIPAGLVIDHLCRNESCVNPNHLEAVTQRENTKRSTNHIGMKMRQTHCIRGHKLTAENISKSAFDRSGRRRCVKCLRIMWKKYNRKRAENKNAISG